MEWKAPFHRETHRSCIAQNDRGKLRFSARGQQRVIAREGEGPCLPLEHLVGAAVPVEEAVADHDHRMALAVIQDLLASALGLSVAEPASAHRPAPFSKRASPMILCPSHVRTGPRREGCTSIPLRSMGLTPACVRFPYTSGCLIR